MAIIIILRAPPPYPTLPQTRAWTCWSHPKQSLGDWKSHKNWYTVKRWIFAVLVYRTIKCDKICVCYKNDWDSLHNVAWPQKVHSGTAHSYVHMQIFASLILTCVCLCVLYSRSLSPPQVACLGASVWWSLASLSIHKQVVMGWPNGIHPLRAPPMLCSDGQQIFCSHCVFLWRANDFRCLPWCCQRPEKLMFGVFIRLWLFVGVN